MKQILAVNVAVLAAVVTVPAHADPVSAAGKSIVINEAVTRGQWGPQDEYVEFENVTDAAIDLSGYRLQFTPPFGPPVPFMDFPAGVSMEPGDFLLYMGEDYFDQFCGGAFGIFDIPDRGTISLHKPNRELVASITVPQNPAPERSPCR